MNSLELFNPTPQPPPRRFREGERYQRRLESSLRRRAFPRNTCQTHRRVTVS